MGASTLMASSTTRYLSLTAIRLGMIAVLLHRTPGNAVPALQALLVCGVAVHHAAMDAQDRAAVEALFLAQDLAVSAPRPSGSVVAQHCCCMCGLYS